MRKGCTLIVRKCDLNTANVGASAKASPFHALIVLGKKRRSILASCMANLSKFHVVFSSSTSTRTPSKGNCAKPLIIVSQYSTDPNIIWDANISLSVISLSSFIGTFILWDVDNLLLRQISEEHLQSMVDSTRKL